MKTFVIVVETAIIAFVFGGAYGMLIESKRTQKAAEQEANEDPEA